MDLPASPAPSPQSSPRRGEEANAASQLYLIGAPSPQSSSTHKGTPFGRRRGEEANAASQRFLTGAAFRKSEHPLLNPLPRGRGGDGGAARVVFRKSE